MTAEVHLPFPFAPADRTIPRMLTLQAKRFGERRLFACGDAQWNVRDALNEAATAGGWLAAQGISSGDRVAILSGNRPEVMQMMLGCAWIGAIAVPLNAAARGPQVHYYLENSGARLLIIDATLITNLGDVSFAATALQRIFILPAGVDNEPPGAIGNIACALFNGRAEPLPPAAVAPGDPFAILYTSGTTGPAKGVTCPHAQFYWWGVHTSRFLQLRSGDVLTTTLPLFHTNALNTFFQALLCNCEQVVEPRFSVSGFWPAMVRSRATVTYLLGAMVPMLLAQPPSGDEKRHRVRVALGPGVPAHLHDALRDRSGIALVDGYGSTETNFVIGGTASERMPGRLGTLAPGFEARVVDSGGNQLPAETPGELVLRAGEPFSMATGYFAQPDKTVEAWRNLWFHTGDRVIRHADASFSFVDRLKDSIRRRGENISAYEVEQALISHPDIENAAAFPVPSGLAEDEVMAAIVARDGITIDPAALVEFLRSRLPRFALPRYIEQVPALPQTENGKIAKYLLRSRGVTTATWDREA